MHVYKRESVLVVQAGDSERLAVTVVRKCPSRKGKAEGLLAMESLCKLNVIFRISKSKY